MRPILDSRLRNREPEPGLINLPIPVPSIPVLAPILTPLIGGANPTPPPPKPTATKPTTPTSAARPPPAAPAAPKPPVSNPSGSGGGGSSGGGTSSGGSSGSSGGSNGPNSGNDGGDNPPANSGGSSGNAGSSGSSPGSSGSSGNDGGSSAPGSSGNSPQANAGDAGSNPPSGSSPSTPASGTSPDSEGSLSVSGSTTFRVTSTGVVPLPLNNAAADPSNGDESPSNGVGGVSVQSPVATNVSGVPITPAGSQGSSGPSHAIVGGSSGTGPSGGSDGNPGTDGNSTPSSGSHSHLTAGAIGGIVAVVVIVCTVLAFVILRNRYKRRKDDRRVEWINGYISDGKGSDMLQRADSKRSSWGTPIEHRISNPFRRSLTDSPTDFEEGFFHDTSSPTRSSSPYQYTRDSTAPVLPMPVHSPTEDRSRSPEDPFADVMATAQPIRRMSSLPIRVSLISSQSGGPDPFDDVHEYSVEDHDSVPDTAVSSATFGRGFKAHFPMPPPTAASSTTVFTTQRDTLQTPGICITFPDSPISPTFAAAGTSSYPRRASVTRSFLPSQERRDEVQLDLGDLVTVVSVYEDGWAFIQREKNNERGLVPFTCLEMDNF